ncbi:MAG: hypothetical protein MJE77_09750, partial [Proteobacteria bacterium]|nr:hypothetical protein [Pseudomonadota bacterium]
GPKAEKAYMTAAEQIRQEERELQERLRDEAVLHDRRVNLYAILNARGFTVSEVMRSRIDSCGDLEQLGAWLVRAATADSAAAVLEESR